MISIDNPEIKTLAIELLHQAGIFTNPLRILPIQGGRNNQIFRVECENQKYILKKYFKHPNDSRDRLSNEFTFLKTIYLKSPSQMPKPYAKIESKSAALYEYIEGKILTNSLDVTDSLIIQAGEFVSNINTSFRPLLEKSINPASEACFSIQQHLDQIEFRIKELEKNRYDDSNNQEFNVVLDKIITNWIQIKSAIIKTASKEALNLDEVLPLNQRVLSPSDFGFHNAIIRPNQQVAFIDFEYAGWDDPAKLVGDFFTQVAIKIDPRYLNLFMKKALGNFLISKDIYKRTFLLLDAYKIKWCCIVLNIFLPQHLARRRFANSFLDIVELKKLQLLKAKKLLKEISL